MSFELILSKTFKKSLDEMFDMFCGLDSHI